MVGKYSILIVALFFGAMTGVLPRANTSAQKIVNPLFVKKPQLKLRYNYFVKMLAKHSPELKSSFEKAFSWGFRAAKRFTLDKQAEDQFLDELEADTKLAPVYKEALFSFSEDMNPSSWGKIILGTAGGIAAVVVLAATVMWYRDKRQAERERLAVEAADQKRRLEQEWDQHMVNAYQYNQALCRFTRSVPLPRSPLVTDSVIRAQRLEEEKADIMRKINQLKHQIELLDNEFTKQPSAEEEFENFRKKLENQLLIIKLYFELGWKQENVLPDAFNRARTLLEYISKMQRQALSQVLSPHKAQYLTWLTIQVNTLLQVNEGRHIETLSRRT
jgi:hypothetical protein